MKISSLRLMNPVVHDVTFCAQLEINNVFTCRLDVFNVCDSMGDVSLSLSLSSLSGSLSLSLSLSLSIYLNIYMYIYIYAYTYIHTLNILTIIW